MARRKRILPDTIDQLTPASYNPRVISDEALAGLTESLEQFGDLSGITWNRRTGNLVAGHQRVKALQQRHGNIAIVDGAAVTPSGERFAVRVVDWPIERERAANVAANNPAIQGTFDDTIGDLLAQIQQDTPDLWGTDLGFDTLLGLVNVDWTTPAPGEGEGKSFDETAASDVKMLECPECHHKWPA